ncbi:hypothetical protein A2382_00895 [Candidatus Woesebacteria bacterium RIFOXYB1_FULL_38_16]|uniref:DUF4012 domain-containing protein n=1 Tax=Candidatus Woesebacteria bacterium RIFOXYB1_FULL_38_16 TaxID=1802538 RepID=A0A1F8CSJ9_9BACT|nr:MAG: hypothetical protein A2191_00610 [Candidatus Woesebacteria bacterium RIFOXYA1_FULL_38_9]OGM79323.1 MAG: hypothetical protein A2382_00895 [Candidatus Woesebacteria bacterium RIFOXYB1_FULL_38_16]
MSDLDIPQIKPTEEKGFEKISLNDSMANTGVGIKSVQEERRFSSKDENEAESKLQKMTKKRIRIGLKTKLLFGILGITLLLFLIGIAVPGFFVYKSAINLVDSAKEVKASVESQDIEKIESEIKVFKKDLLGFGKTYNLLSWTQFVPVVGGYWKDGRSFIKAGEYGIEAGEVVIETIKPYADIIGFAGAGSEQAQSGEETANDRIEFIVQTIEDVLPKMDEIGGKAELAKAEIDKVDTSRYPEKLMGREIRSNLEKVVDMAEEATSFISESKPLMEVAPHLLGIDGERTYLVLFQNDKELRPTGGFITAYSIMKVKNGKFQPVSSSDIYSLDNNYKASVKAPDVFEKYLKGPYIVSDYYRLRDMNWSPDFKESMDLFVRESGKAGIKDIDGVIAVDTQVLVYILDVIGQIGVPGYGNFSTAIDERCNCPNVIYELESFADVEGPVVWSENEPGKIVFAPPNYDNRKKIVGPLMNSILSNAMGQEKAKLPKLFLAGWNSIIEKHVLMYMLDSEAQAGVEKFNLAGRVLPYEGDYLFVNDANLGGRKSNMYVVQEALQEVEISRNGEVTKTLTLTYKNPQDYDGWLNSVLPNWNRIYVPLGSELISAEGYDEKGETYEEFGKTVFSGGFELRPQGVKKIVVKYKLPFKVKDEYKILMQKQPGLDGPLYTVEVGKRIEEMFLKSDKELKFKI